MNSLLHPFLAFAALMLAVAGGVSARDASRIAPVTQTTPEVVVGQGDCSDFSALFHRNRNGHIVRITRGGVTQNFGRGTGGRIISAGSNVGGAPTFEYPSHDAQGRRTVANTNRGNWSYTYRGGVNGDGQLASADHSGPGNWDFVYNTDGIGRRLSSSSPASNGNLLPTGNANDALNRFTSTEWLQQRVLRATLDREANVEITESFNTPTLLPGLPPDPLQPPLRDIVYALASPGSQGGWTAWSITGTLAGGGDPGAAPDRKAKLSGLVLFPPAEENFTYDNAGNRITSARWDYTYDGLNRMTRAVNNDLATAPEAWDVQYTYDAEGRRHRKASKRYSNGTLVDSTITTWIWDGWHPVIERISDPKTGKTITERKLVWGPDISGQPGGAGGAGGLLLIRETNHSFNGRPPVTVDLLPLYDGSGNIVGLANPAGELLAEYWYGPFGELLESSGPKADSNPWRWASKSLDPETGLVYFGLRYYDPATGQWLSREPLGEGESLNLYAYCHNDPINKVDVLGALEWQFFPKYQVSENQIGGFATNGILRTVPRDGSEAHTMLLQQLELLKRGNEAFFESQRRGMVLRSQKWTPSLGKITGERRAMERLSDALLLASQNLGNQLDIYGTYADVDGMLSDEMFSNVQRNIPLTPEVKFMNGGGQTDMTFMFVAPVAKLIAGELVLHSLAEGASQHPNQAFAEAALILAHVRNVKNIPIRVLAHELDDAANATLAAERRVGWATPIPKYDVNAPWWKLVTPRFGVDAGVVTEGRTMAQILATKAHEGQHIRDILNHPQITHLATQKGLFPGSGAARYWMEYRGYSAGGQLRNLATPLNSFNKAQKINLGMDFGIFGVGGAAAGSSIYDYLSN